MTDTKRDTAASPNGSASSDLLGLVERLRAPSMMDTTATYIDRMRMAADEIERLRAELARCGGDNCMGRRCDDVTNWVTEQAAQARVAAERERCAKLCEEMGALEALEGEDEGSAALVRVADRMADLCAAAIRKA